MKTEYPEEAIYYGAEAGKPSCFLLHHQLGGLDKHKGDWK